ncbi:MAG: hypothetical protein IH602_14110 [Bryobacteraceae bacterium]|nr:hypothetical protein [Bryobacteraceae bacterium]
MRILLLIAVLLAGCGRIVKKEAEAEFRSALGRTGITVYPAVVRELGPAVKTSWDNESAAEIAEWLNGNGFGAARVSEQNPDIAVKPGMNQAKMFRTGLRSFGDWLRTHPPETEYACVAEYLMMRNGKAGGIHVYCADRAGTPVFGSLSNSHWPEFKEVNPASVRDAARVAVGSLSRHLDEKKPSHWWSR